MKQAIVIMTLMGCDHGENNCVYIETASQSYQSEAACMIASEKQILGAADAHYPIIMADCSVQAANVDQVETVAAPSVELHRLPVSVKQTTIAEDHNMQTNRSAKALKSLKQFGDNARTTMWQAAVKTTQLVNPF